VEFLRRNQADSDYAGNNQNFSQSYQNLILKILQKLIIQLKIIRDNLREILDYFTVNPHLLNTSRKKQVDYHLFEKFPRYENYPTTEAREKAIHEFITTDEVNLEAVFWNNANHKSLISPLMEDEEGLVINSIVVAPNTNKFHVFIEDTIIRKIGLINDIAAKIIAEIMSRISMAQRRGTTSSNQRRIITVVLNPNECYFVNKLYKYNLQTFLTLTEGEKILSFKDVNEIFKFYLTFIEKQEGTNDFIRLDSNQTYSMIENNIVLILKILKNLVKIGSDSYFQYLQQFFDVFAGGSMQTQGGGAYLYKLACEIILKNLIILMQKLPEKLDKFHFLYDEDSNVHMFI
jgi:hypothetical protein